MPVPYLKILRHSAKNLKERWLKTKGERAFAARAPSLWNNLPEEITSAESVIFFNVHQSGKDITQGP